MSETSVDSQGASRSMQEPQGPRAGGGKLLRWFAILFIIFFVLGVYAILQRRSEHQVLAQQTEQMAVPYVSVIHATPIDDNSEIVLPGNLNAYIESPIYARTNGYLKKWYKDIGARVKAGDLLADIDTPEVDQQLNQAQADLATAQANVSLSAITATRYQDLIKTDSVAKQDVDNANGDLAAKRAMVQSAQANVTRLEAMESFKHVYAPFSGVITQRNVDVGNLINAGNGGTATKEMFDLSQIDPIRVFVSVPQDYAPSIREGLQACLALSEIQGRTFCGRVARTANAIDPGTRTLLTEVDVPNPTGVLLPGAYSQVTFDAKLSGKRFTLPINALLFRPEGTMAAVVEADHRLILKKLTIGRDLGNSVEVLQGIGPGDSVVVNPPDSLESGEQVNVAAASAAGTPNAPTTPGSKP